MVFTLPYLFFSPWPDSFNLNITSFIYSLLFLNGSTMILKVRWWGREKKAYPKAFVHKMCILYYSLSLFFFCLRRKVINSDSVCGRLKIFNSFTIRPEEEGRRRRRQTNPRPFHHHENISRFSVISRHSPLSPFSTSDMKFTLPVEGTSMFSYSTQSFGSFSFPQFLFPFYNDKVSPFSWKKRREEDCK